MASAYQYQEKRKAKVVVSLRVQLDPPRGEQTNGPLNLLLMAASKEYQTAVATNTNQELHDTKHVISLF